MKRLWQGIAIGVLGVAACQWASAWRPARSGIVLTLKTGWGVTRSVTAGTWGMLRIFSRSFRRRTAVGAFAAGRLRRSAPAFARCARVAMYSLLSGAVLWLGLIASPIVDLVQR